MTKAYQMQIQRVVEKAGQQFINVGRPIVVEANGERCAKQKAAVIKLEKKHDEASSYHRFLVAQADTSIGFRNVYMPYQWFILEGKTAWT